MKRTLLAVVIIITAITANAQERQSKKLSSFWKVTTGISSSLLSIDYQTALSKSLILDSRIGWGASPFFDSGSREINYGYPAFSFSTELRYMYSYAKRIETDRDTKLNSSSYLALKTKYYTDTYSAKAKGVYGNFLAISGFWGLQRNLDSNFLFDFHIGLGWGRGFHNNHSGLYPEMAITFSYVFSK